MPTYNIVAPGFIGMILCLTLILLGCSKEDFSYPESHVQIQNSKLICSLRISEAVDQQERSRLAASVATRLWNQFIGHSYTAVKIDLVGHRAFLGSKRHLHLDRWNCFEGKFSIASLTTIEGLSGCKGNRTEAVRAAMFDFFEKLSREYIMEDLQRMMDTFAD